MKNTTTKFKFLGEADKLILEGGTYLITDPCYVLGGNNSSGSDELWQELCSKVFCAKDGGRSGTLVINGYLIWWGSTAFGDGGFQVMSGGDSIGEFGVDAGMFAIFPIEFIKEFGFLNPERFGPIFEMQGGEVEYDGNGNMICGSISVTTDNSDQEDEEEEEEEEEEDSDE